MTATGVEQCTVEHLVQALNLRTSPGPASLNQIRTALPKHLRQCDDALADALQSGQVWKYGRVRGSELYWTEPPAEHAWKLVQEKLTNGPGGLSNTELTKVVTAGKFKDVLDAREWIASLISEGRLFLQVRIAGERTDKYTLDRFDFVNRLVDKFRTSLNQIAENNGLPVQFAFERVRSLLSGVRAEPITQFDGEKVASKPIPTTVSLSSEHPIADSQLSADSKRTTLDGVESQSNTEIRDQILQAMREINPRTDDGDLVLIPELRQRLDFHEIDKPLFDSILLELYRAKRVVLFQTSAGQLGDIERATFVSDEDGNFYNAVAFWKD